MTRSLPDPRGMCDVATAFQNAASSQRVLVLFELLFVCFQGRRLPIDVILFLSCLISSYMGIQLEEHGPVFTKSSYA